MRAKKIKGGFKMHLNDIFDEYKKYTETTDEFDSSEYARKLKNAFDRYGLKCYSALFTPKNKNKENSEAFDINLKYTFSKEESDMLGLFLGCSAPRMSKSLKKYPNKAVLNPFLHKNHRKSMGISDMKAYTDNFVKFEEKRKVLSPTAKTELSRITDFIDFTFKLKKSIEKLIVAIFYMNNFSRLTFDRIIARIDGFTKELYLLNSIDKVPALDLHHAYNDTEMFHSVDILTASDIGDQVYSSRFLSITSTQEFISEPQKHSSYANDYYKYRPLKNPHSINEKSLHSQASYVSYLKKMVYDMLLKFTELLKNNAEGKNIAKILLEDFGVNPLDRSVETLIFEKYIRPESVEILKGNKTLEQAFDDIWKELNKMLTKSESMSNRILSANPEIDSDLDKLLFNPFISFHDVDLEKLKKRAETNDKCLKSLKKRLLNEENKKGTSR